MSDISLSKAVRSNLLSLQNTASMMSKTQERLATGNKVNSALDNPSNFFTATSLNGRAADMGNLLDSMASGIKVIEAANNGLTALTKNLESMQSTLRQARQDKSFQTQSFDVTADTVISLGGGQFGNIGETVSLASATVAGEKASIGTIATTDYVGPSAVDGALAGSGARSVIGINAGLVGQSKIQVAGADVTISGTAGDPVTATTVADDIRAALQGKADTKDKFTVSVGTTGATAGKVIIETIDTSATAANVNLDPDNNPATGNVDAAKKATTTFNYSSVSSNIQAGGEDIATGSTFEQFTANLKAGEKEGNYTVKWDAETKDITLTATTHGADAPEVIGVAKSKLEVAGVAAKTEFTLAATGSSPNKALTHTQTLEFSGVAGSVSLDATDNKTEIQDKILAHLGGEDSKFNVAVDDNLKVTLTEKTNGGLAAPTVTSSQIATGATASFVNGASGADFATTDTLSDDSLQALAGSVITLTSGSSVSTFTISATSTVDELSTALNDAGFTVTLTDEGLDVSRADNAAFTVAATGGFHDELGMASASVNVSAAASHTAAGGVALDDTTLVADVNLQALAGTTIKLTSGSSTESFAINGSSTVAGLTAALTDSGFTVQATADGFNFSRADGAAFEIEIDGGDQTNLGLGASTVTVDNGSLATGNGITGGIKSTLSGTIGAGSDLTDQANINALAGTEIELDDGNGNTSGVLITNGMTRQTLENTLSTNGFKVTTGTNGLSIERADGTNFELKITGANSTALGFATTSVSSTDGEPPAVAQTQGVAFEAAVVGQSSVDADPGVEVETYAALKHEFTVSYDGKNADVTIGSVKGGADSANFNDLDISKWQAKTIASVNMQLESKGITGVEGKFDADGKFSLVAKNAEAKTLTVVGKDAVALFGANAIDTGRAEKSELNATKTVDKFVELINRDHGGKVRASNDNGKLRIENLSTQALDLGVDTNGNDVVNPLKVEGNSVRDNLHKQFNELRDQMDKLSDDASFNGINLLRGDKLTITFNESGSSSINIQSKDKSDQARSINASNLGIDSLVAMDLDSDAGIDAFLGKISSALSDIRSQASTFGSNLSSVENRQTFTKNMINTLQTGAANLTLADMNEEAANLLALQTRQSLSSSALSMASQADQSILQLLR
jgi:hypothetical protein